MASLHSSTKVLRPIGSENLRRSALATARRRTSDLLADPGRMLRVRRVSSEPPSEASQRGDRPSVGSLAQRAVAWRSGGPNVASSQNGSRGPQNGEHPGDLSQGTVTMSDMSQPKRHHFVPRAYLERFGRDSRLLIRRRDGTSPFVANATNIAVECGFYAIDRPDGTKSVEVEELLANIDTHAIKAIRNIDQTGSLPDSDSEDREALAAFIALHLTRTPEQRERVLFPLRVSEYAAGRQVTQPLVAEYLEKIHLGFKPSETEAQAAFELAEYVLRTPEVLTREFAIQTMLRTVPQLKARLKQRSWTLEVARKPRLITADTPVVIWRSPTERDQFEGIGVDNAEEIRFPLDTQKQIVLLPDDAPERTVTIEPARVRSCNADVASGCHQFAIGHPNRPRVLEQVALARNRPVLRFDTGPGFEIAPDGSRTYMGEIHHTWVPRR